MSNTGRAVVVGEYAGADSTISLRLDERVDVLKKSDKWWYVSRSSSSSCSTGDDSTATTASAVPAAKGYFPAICLRELAPSELPALPIGWHRSLSSDNRVYYYNEVSGESQWVCPMVAHAQPLPPPRCHTPSGVSSITRGGGEGENTAGAPESGAAVTDIGHTKTPPPPPFLSVRIPQSAHTPHSSISEDILPPAMTPVGHYNGGPHFLQNVAEGDEEAGYSSRTSLRRPPSASGSAAAAAVAATGGAIAAAIAAAGGRSSSGISGFDSDSDMDTDVGVHHLPEDLKIDIEHFSIQGFADSHFNSHKRWTLFRGRQQLKPEEVLSFTKSPIRQSLTRLSKHSEGFAVKLYPRVIALVENDKKWWGPAVDYKHAFNEILTTVDAHARSDHFIIDEAFCQVVKACTNNPSTASTERGWALLYACMICFTPSRDLAKYLYKQSRRLRQIPSAVGGFAICVNNLVLLQLQNSTGLPSKIHPSTVEMPIHIDPVMRYHIPEQLYGCPVECVVLWEAVQMVADGMGEDLRSSTISNIGRETTTDANKVYISDQLPSLSDALHTQTPLGLLVLLCDTVVNLGGGRKPGIFREAANVDEVKHFIQKIDKGELECLLFASEAGPEIDITASATAKSGADVVDDVLVACDLLKIWFRRLPQPIVPYSSYAQCVKAGQRGDADLATDVLNSMPPLYATTLGYLCSFIKYISRFSAVTLMEVSNLCLVFAPNVIKNPTDDMSAIVMNAESEKRCLQLFVDILGGDGGGEGGEWPPT